MSPRPIIPKAPITNTTIPLSKFMRSTSNPKVIQNMGMYIPIYRRFKINLTMMLPRKNVILLIGAAKELSSVPAYNSSTILHTKPLINVTPKVNTMNPSMANVR
ncbi:103aa long hypothetical protein [Pyrococcus horikoshii OT3]|uniref:Uncharacterized protein n=1 Tax=Pyrococcus horikoshii (strain ATCC 700860 / DSM 12428 / JCM 9974 / NBRC 100139 / OT-3) TaxID=70601 RepID=O59510_PYRHO|nr:103aa long hypothetical protein [Pyrococcus horikoshii OT3]